MKCDAFAEDLADFIDGALDPERRRAVERHLETCDACRAIVADLQAIQAAAFTLDRLQPPAQVWEALQARLTQEPSVDRDASVQPRLGVVAWKPWLAAAAALLLATAIGLWSLGRVGQTPAEGPGNVPAGELVASVEADLEAAEAHYEKAIQGLELIAKSGNEALDPAVAVVLQKNLQVIDQAIDESRAAVRVQPASVDAQESLFDAMRNKVALLQQTVELINEMRKGNQAEAGRIMQGLSQP